MHLSRYTSRSISVHQALHLFYRHKVEIAKNGILQCRSCKGILQCLLVIMRISYQTVYHATNESIACTDTVHFMLNVVDAGML